MKNRLKATPKPSKIYQKSNKNGLKINRGGKKSINKNQPKNESKIDQKSMQNTSKIDQKSTKNGPKISLGGVSGGPWGLLAAKIEKMREKKTNFWGLLGPSWGRLGGLLGPSWRLDRRLGPSWGVLGSSWAV